jgi:hypothetical protein
MRLAPLFVCVVALGSGFSACAPAPVPGARPAETRAQLSKLRALGAFPALHGVKPTDLQITHPERARLPLHVASTTRDVWISVTPEGARDVGARHEAGAVIFDDPEDETSIVYAGAEEIRVLHGEAASPVARYRLAVGPAVAQVRAYGGRVQIVDRDGVVRLESLPIFAIDSHGARRGGSVRVEAIDGRTFALETEIDPRGLAYPIAVDPAWTSGGVMSGGHQHFLMLKSGKILAVGGATTSELYDPATNAFTFSGAISSSRPESMAAALGDGGAIIGGPDATTEVWDPTTSVWSAGPDLTEGRKGGAAVQLKDGRALFAAGFYTGASETYDPVTKTMKATVTGTNVHYGPAMIVIPDGRVLVAGGIDNAGYPSPGMEIFDPKTDTWLPAASMKKARKGFSFGLLPSGEVMALGGIDATAEIWSPTTQLWRWAAASPRTRSSPALVATANGMMLAAGGGDPSGDGDVYDLAGDRWFSVKGGTPRGAATGFLLPSGLSFVAGGAAAADRFQLLSLGGSCTQNAECLSGFCVDGVCCDGACTGSCEACDLGGGICKPVTGALHGARSCGTFATCTAGVCDAKCTSNDGCTSTSYCDGGACVPKRKNGLACVADGDCGSGICVDGVCCDSRCSGQCEACDVPGSFGTCAPVTGAPRNGRALCAGVGAGTVCGIRCDGSDRTQCTYPGATVACGGKGCSAGVARRLSACDGAGLCADTSTSCGAYACGVDACLNACTTGADCAAGHYCKAGACVKAEDLGAACASDAACSGGHCVDGVCCATATCAAGASCAPKTGLCVANLGTACNVDAECGSGHCVDGVCCDGACGGQCEACDVKGAEGTCQPIAGAPHGVRTPCSAGSAECAALACDGAERASCAGFRDGPSVPCGAPTCAGERFTAAGKCDGKGSCALPASDSCVPFACDAKGCLSSCAGDGDCAQGFECKSGSCLARAATCSGDGLASIDKLGVATPCAPYLCGGDGACKKTCETTADCQAGTLCDSTSKSCIAQTTDAGSDGGCSLAGAAGGRGSRGGRSGGWLAMLALGAVIAGRRRTLAWLASASALLAGCQVDAPSSAKPAPAPSEPVGHQAQALSVAWRSLPRMNYARVDHRANALPDGRVIVMGGSVNNYGYHASVEIWDPATNKWSLVTPMPDTRVSFASATLSDGHVLTVGGVGGMGPYPGDYDPALDQWYFTGQVLQDQGCSAYPFGDATAFVATATHGNWLYRTSTHALEWIAQPLTTRVAGVLVKLKDDRVLRTAGFTDGTGATPATGAEIYDHATDSWTPIAEGAGFQGPSVLLNDGRVFFYGQKTRIFDPKTSTWATKTTMPTERYGWTFTMPNGRVVIVGSNETRVDVYDPDTDTWTVSATMPRKSYRDGATQRPDGSIVYTGGMEIPTFISTDESELFRFVGDGEVCDLGGECLSKSCVSGLCCDTACAGACQACDVPGKLGKCTALDGAPHYGRSCGASFACVAGACATSCSDDSVCLASGWCDGATCQAKATPGQACKTDHECASGFCTDGVCCDARCGGQCEACDAKGTEGTCTPVYGAPHGVRPGCTGAGLGTTCGPVCDGKDPKKCTFAKATTQCSADACDAGIETHASLCDGAGACTDAPVSCGAYACGGAACRVTCAADGDCSAGHYCKAGACVVIEDLGTACASGSACKTGFCVEGVCCASATCGAGSSCAAPGHKGLCAKLPGLGCTVASECASGHCVDGVCCESTCDGQCEACDVPAAKGKCTPVVGAPHGARAACDDGGGATCAARACDGTKDTKACVGYVADAKTSCAPAKCEGGTLTPAATCDGGGQCVIPATTSCAPYACLGDACRTGCTVDEHCTSGFECRAGKCVSKGNKCSDDGLASIDKDGKRTECAPFRCDSTGVCLNECVTAADCAQFLCDTTSKTCLDPASIVAPSSSSGGCRYGGRARASAGWSALALLGLLALRRRRAA